MISNYVMLGFSCLALLFILLGMLWGIIRGLRKTVSRGIFLLVTTIVLIFVTVPIANAILGISLNTTITTNGVETQTTLTISELISHFLTEFLGEDFVNNNPGLTDLIIAFPKSIICVLLYIILFWVCKYLLLPLDYLLYRLTLAPRKKYEDVEDTSTEEDGKKKKKKVKVKYKKHRLWGALVGIFVGILITFNTMIPFYGFMDIFNTINTIKINENSEDEISLSKLSDNMTDEIIHGYNISATAQISDFTKLKALGLNIFDNLSAMEFGETKTNLRSEINSITATTNSINKLLTDYNNLVVDGKLKKLNQEELDLLVTDTKEIITAVKTIKSIDALGDFIIPAACKIMADNDMKITNNPNVDRLIIDTFVAIAESQGINVFDELNALVDIIDYTNSQKILLPIINNEFSFNAMVTALDDNFAETFVNKLYNVKIVNVAIPHIVNIGLNYVADGLKVEVEDSNATNEQIKTDLNNMLSKFISLAKTLDDSSKTLITTNSIVPLGGMLDAVKDSNIVTTNTYNNLIDYTTNKLREISDDIIPEDYRNFFNNGVLKNISKVNNWTQEMTSIDEGIKILRNKENGILGDVQEDKELREGLSVHLDVKSETLENLGIALDKLENTILFGNKVETPIDDSVYTLSPVKTLFVSIMDMMNDKITEKYAEGDSMRDFTKIIKTIKSNILNDNTSNTKFWETEMHYSAPLLEEVYSMIDADDFKITDNLGKNLDYSRNTVMLGKTTTLELMSISLNIVEDQILGEDFSYNNNIDTQNTDDLIYEAFKDINNRLISQDIQNQFLANSEFWEEEIVGYKALQNVSEQTNSINDTEDALKIAPDLDIAFKHNRTIPRLSISKLIAKTMKQIKTNVTTGVEGEINNLIETISTKLTTPTFFDDKEIEDFWTIEFGYLNDLNNIEFTDNNENNYKVVDNLDKIGNTLDKVALLGYQKTISDNPKTPEIESGIKTIHPSYLIEEDNIRNILSVSIDEMREDLLSSFAEGTIRTTVGTALTNIASNLSPTSSIESISFKIELTNLQILSKIEINPDVFEVVEIKDTDTPEVKAEKQAKIDANALALTTIGANLDRIGHKTTTDTSTNITTYIDNSDYSTYTYDNSRIITRTILNDLMVGIFDVAKNSTSTEIENIEDSLPNEEKTKLAFDNTILRIKNEITSAKLTVDNSDPLNPKTIEKVFSWERELSYITTLTNLNAGQEYNVDNAGEKLSGNLDIIAFNYDTDGNYLDIKYNEFGNITSYPEGDNTNSVFITRDILKYAVEDLSGTIELNDIDADCLDIVKDLINNVSDKVASSSAETTNDNNYYPNFNTSFTDLTNVKNTITENSDKFATETLVNIKTNNTAKDYDEMLQDLQNKLICHNITTRKVAILIFDKLYNTMIDSTKELADQYKFENLDAGDYIENLTSHYETINASTNASTLAEKYYDASQDITNTDINQDFDNPFERLVNIYSIPTP